LARHGNRVVINRSISMEDGSAGTKDTMRDAIEKRKDITKGRELKRGGAETGSSSSS